MERQGRDNAMNVIARRMLRFAMIVAAILVVAFEETIWRLAKAIGRVVWSVSIFAAFERLIAGLSPGAVVAAFMIPLVAVSITLKFGEFWLFEHGHLATGLVAVLLIKVLGVSFSARLFEVAKPKMLQVAWFAWTYRRIVGIRSWLAVQPGVREAVAGYHRVHDAAAAFGTATMRRLGLGSV